MREAKVTSLWREVTTSCVLHGPQLGAYPLPTSSYAWVSQQRTLLKHKFVCKMGTQSWMADARLKKALHFSPAAPPAGEMEAQ